MKFVLFACIVAFVAASPAPQRQQQQQQQQQQRESRILVDERDVRADGFNFNFETDDGYKRVEEGRPTGETGALAHTGEIQFTFPDGQVFTLRYIADENGYRAESPFLPQAHQK